MMKTIHTKLFRLSLILVTPIVGAAIYWIMLHYTRPILRECFTSSAKETAGIISTAVIAMMGLLASLIIIVTSIPDSYFARKFKRDGYRTNFLCFYFGCLMWLAATHILSIFSMANELIFIAMICLFAVSLMQFLLLTFGAFKIADRAKHDPAMTN